MRGYIIPARAASAQEPAPAPAGVRALAKQADRDKFRREGKDMRAVLAVIGMLALGAGTPVGGAAEPRPMPLKLAAAVDLENKRLVALLDFEIVSPASDRTPETVVGKLEKPLAAGASASLPLSGGDGCLYQARWAFEDFKDAGDVDLCGNAHIILVD